MKLFLLFIVLIVSLSPIAHGQTTTKFNVVTESWEGWTNEDGTGFYFDLLRLVYEPAGVEVVHHIAPYERSVNEVQHNRKDAWVASYEDEQEGVIYPKIPMGFDNVTALYKPDNIPVWRGEESLKDRPVAWIRGYEYNEYLSVATKWHEVNNRKSALGMLRADRVDVFLDDEMEIQDLIESTQLDMETFRTETFLRLNVYMAYASTDKGQWLANVWDRRMLELFESGQLEQFWKNSDDTEFPFRHLADYFAQIRAQLDDAHSEQLIP